MSSPSRSASPTTSSPSAALASSISDITVPSARPSLDSTGSLAPNGLTNGSTSDLNEAAEDDVSQLRKELAKTRAEKDSLSTQYHNLLAKLTTMRTTLGTKLKQDAEELDRREVLVQQLQLRNDDLTNTVDTLQAEFEDSCDDVTRLTAELDALRANQLNDSAHGDRELRETQAALERTRLDKEEWERIAARERVLADESRAIMDALRRDLEKVDEERLKAQDELGSERERGRNLQGVLEDFQAAKDHELQQAVRDYEAQLIQATQSLAEYKHRALTAEMELEESQSTTVLTQSLQKDLKEKNLLIGKLRHEAVILNAHLIESLRRLRNNTTSSSTTVDTRLVTNVLLSFLTTPRADAKRFEMLGLLGTILNWNEQEREKAGLQRAGGASLVSATSASSPSGGGFWGKGKTPEPEKTDETESFSRLWVEFLLTESNSSNEATSSSSSSTLSPSLHSNASFPGSPITQSFASLSLSDSSRPAPLESRRASDVSRSYGPSTRRLASFGAPSLSDSPTPPPQRAKNESAS